MCKSGTRKYPYVWTIFSAPNYCGWYASSLATHTIEVSKSGRYLTYQWQWELLLSAIRRILRQAVRQISLLFVSYPVGTFCLSKWTAWATPCLGSLKKWLALSLYYLIWFWIVLLRCQLFKCNLTHKERLEGLASSRTKIRNKILTLSKLTENLGDLRENEELIIKLKGLYGGDLPSEARKLNKSQLLSRTNSLSKLTTSTRRP